jgi:hypothetical protein
MSDRQRYISPYLTHFAGRECKSDDERYEVLKKILKEGWILSQTLDGCTSSLKARQTSAAIQIRFEENISESRNQMVNPEMVCFCDIPIGDLHIHTEKYSHFGLAFDKQFIASHRGGPVYYVPIHASSVLPGGEGPERKHEIDRGFRECYDLLHELIRANNEWSVKANEVDSFLISNIYAYVCCFDHMLPENDPKNYYFEREWRILGSLRFHLSDVRIILLPERYARRFREDFPEYCGQLIFL